MRKAQWLHSRDHVPKLRRGRAVVAEAVRLDDQPEVRPEEIDLEIVDALFGERNR
jgi:hypothetical protein